MEISRAWAMPNRRTFQIKPIADLLQRRLRKYQVDDKIIVDPFSGFSKIADLTNDLNPHCKADHSLHAEQFLQMILNEQLCCDVVLFDPPYSLRQAKEMYEWNKMKFSKEDAQDIGRWPKEKDLIAEVSPEMVISFGWNSNGIGKKRGYKIIEILLVAHGSAHNDTICTVEIKL